MSRPLGAEGRLAGLPLLSPALTAPPLSPACSPGISRSTSPNPASPLLPEACWRGTAQSLKGPQQKGSLGRKQGDQEERAVTHQRPGAASVPPLHTRLCRGSPPPCLQPKEPAGTSCPRPACSRVTVDPCTPYSSPCTPYSASGRLAPAQARVGCPRRGSPSDRNPPPGARARGRPAADVHTRFYSVNKDYETSKLLAPRK